MPIQVSSIGGRQVEFLMYKTGKMCVFLIMQNIHKIDHFNHF